MGRVRNGDRAVWGAHFFCETTAAEEAERYFRAQPMPPKNACGYFSARTSSTFAPCLRHARSTSAMNAADMLLIVAPPLTSTGSILGWSGRQHDKTAIDGF
jgi:hypothetical protein